MHHLCDIRSLVESRGRAGDKGPVYPSENTYILTSQQGKNDKKIDIFTQSRPDKNKHRQNLLFFFKIDFDFEIVFHKISFLFNVNFDYRILYRYILHDINVDYNVN